jgi:acetyl esterase/lipase
MREYAIHSDFAGLAKINNNVPAPLLPIANASMRLIFSVTKPLKGVRETSVKLGGFKVVVYKPDNLPDKSPCLVYFHGGAFLLAAAPYHKWLLWQYALQVPCCVVFVDYRLAPKYPFPVGLNDCYAAFEWVCANTKELGVDRNKIAVGGDSAGGALAAAVCMMARDRQSAARPLFQMLIYPVTDARQGTESMRKYTDTPLWNAPSNANMWETYLKNGTGEHREYASPAEAKTFADLPPAYIEVAEFDCLHDEGVAFAQSLRNTGIDVQLYETYGTIHGFEMSKNSAIVAESIRKRVAYMSQQFI